MKKALAALLMVPSMAMAEFELGNSLLAQMQSSHNIDKMHALGYIKGVVDVYLNVTICPPNNGRGVTAGQISDMIKNYMENSPSIRHKTAESIINDALKTVWPCPTRRSGTGV